MTHHPRALLRAAAAAAGLVAVVAFSAPAHAATVDIALDPTGTTIAAGSDGKLGSITIKNLGDTTPAEIVVTFDLSQVRTVAVVNGFFLNQGDMTADGVKVTVTLPAKATFAEVEPGCVYTADNRTVTCQYADITLIPADHDTTKDSAKSAGAAFFR
jgi:hypothetical protein